MERRIKVLGYLLIIVVVITTLGCASSGLRLEGKKGANELSFVDWSNGLPSTGQWRQGLSFYDMNGDGHVDIAAPPPRQAKKGHDTPAVWHGNGKGEWSEVRPDVPSDIIYNYGGIAVADFDGDGIPDIGLAMHGMGVKVLKGKGKDKYVDFSDSLPSKKEFASRAIVSADFNNDGIVDIAAVSEAKFGDNFPIPGGVWMCQSHDNTWRCSPIGDEKEVRGLFADQLIAGDVNGDGNKDIAVAWHKGSTWFKVPSSVKIVLEGTLDARVTAKDIVLNLLDHFGASALLGSAIEMEGEAVEKLTLDQRITIASMATEMGAIIILFRPNMEVIRYCESRTRNKVEPVLADEDAVYNEVYHLDVAKFTCRISLPGKPHDTSGLPKEKVWIDSAFIGSCTNGRIEDMRAAAAVLKGRGVAEGVVLKIVPATDRVWNRCMEEGLLKVFKESGALVSNAGCAGCAAGQVGQNGPGEITVSTGNRNFPGKQGQGEVYLASPSVVAASAVAGYITTAEAIPVVPVKREFRGPAGDPSKQKKQAASASASIRPHEIEGRAWYIPMDNIDTDMIYHNRHLSITDTGEMGQFTFGNLAGYEDFAKKVKPGDIVVTGKNFGSGSSRQQAVDCFISLGVQCVVAESFGAIYERNAINAAFPIVTSDHITTLKFEEGDVIRLNFETGAIQNVTKMISLESAPFSDVQMEIYQNNGLF